MFAAHCRHLIALTVDAFPTMTQRSICEAFMQLAAAGLDRDFVEVPQHSKISPAYREPMAEYKFDHNRPHRLPTITPPVDEPDDAHLNVNL